MTSCPVAELPPRSLPAAVGRFVAVAAAYSVAALIGLAFRSEPERVTAFWPPNGLLLGLLLVCRPADRWLTAGAGCAACLLANLAGGNSFLVSLGFTAVNVAEPILAAAALRWVRRGPFAVDGVRDVFAFFAVAFGVPLLCAVPGACVVVFGLGAPDFPRVLVGFWLADAVGVVLVTPLVLAWAGTGRADLRFASWGRAAEGLALFVGLGASGVLLFAQAFEGGHYALSHPFPLLPFFVWAGLRFGTRGAATAVMTVALSAVWFTGHGRGPFVDPAASAASALLMCQLFLSVKALGGLALAAALAERDRAAAALAASEERHRGLVENIREVFWMMAPDLGRVFYVSPQYEQVWGRSCASLYADPGSFLAAFHPDDYQRLVNPERRAACDGYSDEQFRVVRPDGSVRWVHSRTFPMFDAAGNLTRIVGIAHDVTAAKEADLAQAALVEQLQKALGEVKALRGMIPVCAWCRCLRDDAGYWQTLEEYLKTQTDASVTHGICPTCLDGMTGELGKLAARS